jgi:hypothetical protein
LDFVSVRPCEVEASQKRLSRRAAGIDSREAMNVRRSRIFYCAFKLEVIPDILDGRVCDIVIKNVSLQIVDALVFCLGGSS